MYRHPGEIITVEIEGYEDIRLQDLLSKDFAVTEVDQNTFMVRLEGKQYEARIISTNGQGRGYVLRINGVDFVCKTKTRLDHLIDELGFHKGSKVHDLHLLAPMPGLVLDIHVTEGTEVKAGDTLITLEAMKMENILRAEFDGVIDQITVRAGDKVDKNQLLLQFSAPQG